MKASNTSSFSNLTKNKSVTFLTVLNHIIWSCLPIISRYLQVLAPIKVDELVLVSTSKLVSSICVLAFGNIKFLKPSTTQEELLQKNQDIVHDDDDAEETPERYRKKILYGISCAALSAARSILTLSVLKFTTATNSGEGRR